MAEHASVHNCYHKSVDADNDDIADEMDIFDGASAKTKAQFNSGSVCVKLNTGAGLKEHDKPIFYQNLTAKSGTTIDDNLVLDLQHKKVYLVNHSVWNGV